MPQWPLVYSRLGEQPQPTGRHEYNEGRPGKELSKGRSRSREHGDEHDTETAIVINARCRQDDTSLRRSHNAPWYVSFLPDADLHRTIDSVPSPKDNFEKHT